MHTPVFIAAPSDGWALVYPWFTTESSVFTLLVSIIIQVSFPCLAEMALSRCPQSSIPLLKQVHGRCWNTEKRRAVGAVGMKFKAEDDSSIECNWMMSWRNRKLWMRKLGPHLQVHLLLKPLQYAFSRPRYRICWRRKPAISWCSYRSFQGTCNAEVGESRGSERYIEQDSEWKDNTSDCEQEQAQGSWGIFEQTIIGRHCGPRRHCYRYHAEFRWCSPPFPRCQFRIRALLLLSLWQLCAKWFTIPFPHNCISQKHSLELLYFAIF